MINDLPNYVRVGQILEDSDGSCFEMGEKLGGGSCGQVFEGCFWKKNGERENVYAVKLVQYEPGEECEAEREVEMLKICQNVENIVVLQKSFDVMINDQNFKLMAFERMGPSLESLTRHRILSVPNCLKIGYTLLQVFSDLKKLGVIHQDLHSENVMFCHDLKHMKLGDFGDAEKAKRNKNVHRDAKCYSYGFDAASVLFLLSCCRTDIKNIKNRNCTTSAYLNELKAVKEGLLDNNMLFLQGFTDELLIQVRDSNVSYSKLRHALISSSATFSPSDNFIVTNDVPPMLA
ncbi:hypothetical protein B9Z55_022124 [Caenorhabditis nigoni]|nr:hypothetical protein B9Z55_022124 [Caenorhabditis nigoni]